MCEEWRIPNLKNEKTKNFWKKIIFFIQHFCSFLTSMHAKECVLIAKAAQKPKNVLWYTLYSRGREFFEIISELQILVSLRENKNLCEKSSHVKSMSL